MSTGDGASNVDCCALQSFDSRPVLTAALKHGRFFLEAFLRSGIPVINALFRNKKVCYHHEESSTQCLAIDACTITPSNQEEVLALLKNLQRSTRCLQHFCLHSKFSKNMALTRHVPRLKKCLEAFVFSIKVSAVWCHSLCTPIEEDSGALLRGCCLIMALWTHSGWVFSRTETYRCVVMSVVREKY